MKKLFAILLILVSFGAYSQSYNPTGPGWKYTPKIQTDDLQVKTSFKLNGETIKFQSPTDGQVIQRVLKDGQHIWTNKTLSSFMYDSLKFDKTFGIISLYKNGFVAISDTLDGRYALIEDIPTVPTSIWELTGINRTGWEEGKLVKFDSSGNLVVGSTTGASGIGLADLHATAPILYNSTTGTFSFSGETDPSVYPWAKASTKPGYSWTEISSKPTFATVATTGSYTDLINKPTIDLMQINSDWNATTGVAKILNKPTLSTVATTGSFNDLNDKPTLGTTTNSHILKFDTGTTEGTDLYTFNGSASKTVDIKAGENITLTKASGSITISAIVNNDTETPQILTGTTPTWNISNGKNAKISLTGNTTITLTNFSAGQSGSITVLNAPTQYTLNITQSGYVNAISKSIGTPGNYTKLNTTGASAVDKYSWYYDGYYMFWRGETDYIKP